MKMWHIIWFELRMLIRMRVVLLNQFLLPMVLILILGNALSGMISLGDDAPIDTVTAMIVESPGQEALTSVGWNEFLKTPEISELLKVQHGDHREEAISSLKSGDSDFAVVIPTDFADKVMKGESVKWEMIYGKDHSKNHVAEMIFESYLDEVNRVQASTMVLGPNTLNSAPQNVPTSYVEMASLNKEGNAYSAFQYYAASMLIMFLLYSGLTASSSLQSEKRNKTLYRLNSTPISTLKIFLGKIGGNSLVACIQAVVIILGTTWLYGVNWGRHPIYLILLCALVIMAAMLMAVVITLLSKSSESAQTIFQVIIVGMTFLSGGFQRIPVDIIEKLGEFTINHWALQGMIRIILDASTGEILHHVLILGLFNVILLLVGTVSYRKVGYHE
ncbi:ABC transporter permease [Paenibacillus anaericanus]|uniref:ABC transporter permease n=1 Tax=Paenibacillus anaericanus TaxID=170367 RepID=A0A3S1BVH4_9BACL|nr:ABC transporter permease [Paenibacillus anaericanus]RUT48408.1 ABC transporter permease [Paenibacillus anaericanus]